MTPEDAVRVRPGARLTITDDNHADLGVPAGTVLTALEDPDSVIRPWVFYGAHAVTLAVRAPHDPPEHYRWVAVGRLEVVP